MNKQEIQALIDSKIAGQGSAVDVGGVLPKILHEILEAAFAGENVQSNWNETDSQSPQYIQNKPSIPAPYTLPTASAETLGGVKVGSGLSINEGVLSAEGGGGSVSFAVELSGSDYVFSNPQDWQACLEALVAGKIVYLDLYEDSELSRRMLVIGAYDMIDAMRTIGFYDGAGFKSIVL